SEQRNRPAVARPVEGRAGAKQRVAADDRLRVRIVDEAAELLRDERQVGGQVPAPAASEFAAPVEADAPVPLGSESRRIALEVLSCSETRGNADRRNDTGGRR